MQHHVYDKHQVTYNMHCVNKATAHVHYSQFCWLYSACQ